MASDTPDDATESRPRRAPPTIDLDPSQVSGDSLRAEAGRARWKSMMDDLRARVQMPRFDVRASILPGVLAFAGGTVAILLLAGALWAFGWPRMMPPVPETAQRATLDDLTARLARLEQRPAPQAPAQSNARVEAVETALGGIRETLAALQQSDTATAQALAELKSAPRQAPANPAPDLAPLIERLSRLEQAARSESAAASADAKLRLGVIALALDAMVRRGDPFVELLAGAKGAGGSAAVLAPLDGFAATGVPDDVTLSRNLLQLLPQLAPAASAAKGAKTNSTSSAPADSGWLDRLKAGAAGLVSIERVEDGAKAGSDKAGSARDERTLIVTRAKAAAERNDVAAAQRELQRLPDVEAAKPWLDALARRDVAREVSRKFVAATIASFNDAVAR